jgi:hypothetical protein
LGFKSEQSKVKVYYAEIPLATSVLLMDSLRTTNFTGETNRILAGSYIDPVFGPTQAQAYTQFRPYTVNTALPVNAVFDSIFFDMKVDFYQYGAPGQTTLSFDIHEVTQELNQEDNYFFNSEVPITHTSLGSNTLKVSADFFKKEYEDSDADSVITLKVKLDKNFGQRLFDAINPEDVNYTDFDIFKETFKGLAIVPQQADKVIGFNPTDLSSSITLHYHVGAEAKTVSFVFSQCVTFSKISSDRSTTELSGLNQYFTDFDPGLKRYIQGGSSIVTKLDFSKFYDYIDTLTNVVVNSAELEISAVEAPSDLIAPPGLSMSMLRSNNRHAALSSQQDSLTYVAFNGMLTLGDQSKFFAATGPGSILTIGHSTTANTYSGLPTLFVQKLIDLKSTRYLYWALRPIIPQPGKSVDRAVFPKDNIKLKIYYTRATLENQ